MCWATPGGNVCSLFLTHRFGSVSFFLCSPSASQPECQCCQPQEGQKIKANGKIALRVGWFFFRCRDIVQHFVFTGGKLKVMFVLVL
jgi:hypothetical protein